MSPRPRGSPDRDRVDPVGPWGHFVEKVLASHKPRWSYEDAAAPLNTEAEHDGVRGADFDRYNIRSWLLGAEPRKKTWPWIVRGWKLRMDDFAAAIDEHRTWKANQRHSPVTAAPQLAVASPSQTTVPLVPLSAPADRVSIDDLAALTRSYGGLRDVVSPSSLLRPVTDHLDSLLQAVPRTRSSTDAARAKVTTAQTAIIAGWLMFNTGQPGQALAHWLLSHELATEAQHTDLTAYALACRSRLYSRVHRGDRASRPDTALQLVDRAVELARRSQDPALRSWLLVNRAEQHADAGDRLACDRDLESAARVISQSGNRDDVLWTQWSTARLDTYRGNCARLLHRPGDAISVLESFLRMLDTHVIPARTNPLTDLAVAYIERREIEHACELLSDAHSAATAAGYTEGVGRILDVRATFLEPYSEVPAVKQLDEVLRTRR